jgi:rifampicin phosphotransferase
MSYELIASLTHWGLQLEEMFSGPQDIEWTVNEEGRPFLLQSRGITALPPPAVLPSAGRTVLWSNANVNETFPEPICPLLYSVASTG